MLCTGAVATAAAAVRRRVPDDKKCCWFIESGSIQCFFLFIQTQFIFNVCIPLGSTVAFTASICLDYILGNDGHARSQGGRQPVASKPPLEPSILSRVVAALLPYQ